MAISTTAKTLRASERFMLIRLTPRRCISTTWTYLGGFVYELSMPGPIASLVRYDNPTLYPTQTTPLTLTAVTATPTVNDTYYYNDATGVLQVKSSVGTDTFYADYYLFYTGHRTREVSQNPDDSATQVREWQPRLAGYPTVRQSFKNLISGVFSTEASSIEIINGDHTFEALLTTNDSFYRKPVEIWLGVNDTSNLQKIYTGYVSRIRLSRGTATVSFTDSFAKLNEPATMGDTSDTVHFYRSSGSFSALDPAHAGKPIPLILAKYSPYTYRNSPWGAGYEDLNPVNCYQAVCTNYSASPGTSSNRRWGLCRIPAVGLRTPVLSIGAKLDVSSGGNSTIIEYTQAVWDAADPTRDIQIGDLVRIVEGANTRYGRLISLPLDYGATVGIVIGTFGNTAAFTTACVLTWLPDPALVITSGKTTFLPAPIRDYTYSLTTLAGGNKYLDITFVNNFEAGITGHTETGTGTYSSATLTTLDPAIHQINYRVSVATSSMNHADVLKSILEVAGLTVDATTFAATKAALAVNTWFSIPFKGESTYGSYRNYAEAILTSSAGYVYLNAAGAVEYKLLAVPSSTNAVDDNTILKNSISIDIDYNDIITELTVSNMHNIGTEALDTAKPATKTEYDGRGRYLHGLVKSLKLEHVLEHAIDRIYALLYVRSKRRATYELTTATEHIDSLLGQDLQLESDQVLGGSGVADLKIIGIDRNADKTTLTVTDFEDI